MTVEKDARYYVFGASVPPSGPLRPMFLYTCQKCGRRFVGPGGVAKCDTCGALNRYVGPPEMWRLVGAEEAEQE